MIFAQRPRPRAETGRPHVIVFGNEKGGSGKSTTAMHVIVALMRRGHRVASLDLDARQATLTRYVENRAGFAGTSGIPLMLPDHHSIARSASDSLAEACAEEGRRFEAAMAEIGDAEFVVVDTPGSDSHLSRLGHGRADTLVTPMNDSFLDLDLLARLDGDGRRILGPSLYAEMVWEQRKARARRDGGSIDWIVLRNRLGHVQARNQRDIGHLLDELSRRIGFRQAPGFGERVIFRELFPRGLTLLDLREVGAGIPLRMSHLAARQEVRALVEAIGLAEALDSATPGSQPAATPPEGKTSSGP